MLVRLFLINSILMLLMLGNPKAANITLALATNGPRLPKDAGTSLNRRNRHEANLFCGASERSFRQTTQPVSHQAFLSGNRFCLCKLVENGFGGHFTEAPRRFVLRSSSVALVNGAETVKTLRFAKPCTWIPAAPSFGPTPPGEMKAIGVREMVQQARVEKTKTQSGQFAAIANIEPGCVALSELTDGGTGAQWLGPQQSSDPLRQHAILFEAWLKGRLSLIDFLKGPETHTGFAQHGSATQAQS